MKMGLLTVMFIFLFMDVLVTVGTLAGVAELGGYMGTARCRGQDGHLSDAAYLRRAMSDAYVTSYIEAPPYHKRRQDGLQCRDPLCCGGHVFSPRKDGGGG
jgi:hypothetical protein